MGFLRNVYRQSRTQLPGWAYRYSEGHQPGVLPLPSRLSAKKFAACAHQAGISPTTLEALATAVEQSTDVGRDARAALLTELFRDAGEHFPQVTPQPVRAGPTKEEPSAKSQAPSGRRAKRQARKAARERATQPLRELGSSLPLGLSLESLPGRFRSDTETAISITDQDFLSFRRVLDLAYVFVEPVSEKGGQTTWRLENFYSNTKPEVVGAVRQAAAACNAHVEVVNRVNPRGWRSP